MNVRLLISLFFFNSALNFAQTEIQPEIGALVYTSRKGYYDSGKTHDLGNGRMVLSNNSYSGIKLKFGARFLFNDKSFSLNTQYQFLESRL